MSCPIHISIQEEVFDSGEELIRLQGDETGIGAIVSFLGLVRDIHKGDTVNTLTLEHYPGMTESSLQDIAKQAEKRWALQGIRIIHRVGTLSPSDVIVLVAVASKHRGNAFSACEYIMDYLKTRAPFWKKEVTSDGERWVDARESDTDAAERWKNKKI